MALRPALGDRAVPIRIAAAAFVAEDSATEARRVEVILEFLG